MPADFISTHIYPADPLGFEGANTEDQLAQATREPGVDVRLNAAVEGIEKTSSHLFALAIRSGLHASDLKEMLYA